MITSKLSPKQIGKRIAGLRKRKGYSQEDLARFMQIPRSSVAQIELGNRNISVYELMSIAEMFGFSIDKFLASEYQTEMQIERVEEPAPAKYDVRVSAPLLNSNKFTNILLYILHKCGGKPNVGETVLYKLLYFADFNYYEIYEEHLTGAQYLKFSHGPVPQNIENILIQMTDSGQIHRIKTMYHGFPQTKFIALKFADLTTFSAAERKVIDKVIEQFSDWSAKKISDYSHDDKPWRATDENELIDYELVFYRRPPYSVREYEEGE